MNEDRVRELFSNEAFVKELFTTETPEEVKALLADNGIELSIDEIISLKELLVKKMQSGDELAEDDLEEVAGGYVGFFIFSAVLVLGTLAGFTIAVMATDRKNRW